VWGEMLGLLSWLIDGFKGYYIYDVLGSLSKKVDPAKADIVIKEMAGFLDQINKDSKEDYIQNILGDISQKVEPSKADIVLRETAEFLSQVPEELKENYIQYVLGGLSQQVGPAAADIAIKEMAEFLANISRKHRRSFIYNIFGSLAKKVEPTKAPEVLTYMSKNMEQFPGNNDIYTPRVLLSLKNIIEKMPIEQVVDNSYGITDRNDLDEMERAFNTERYKSLTLTIKDISSLPEFYSRGQVIGVFNPGVVDDKMVFRVWYADGSSVIGSAEIDYDDILDEYVLDKKTISLILKPEDLPGKKSIACEDPRLTKIG
jgi:hypothetical protein